MLFWYKDLSLHCIYRLLQLSLYLIEAIRCIPNKEWLE